MVTQLRYQDPLNPTDSADFLAQTAQFTALEKMQAVADQTAMLVSTQLAFGAGSLVGKTVQWVDETGAEHTGTVRGTTFLATGPVLDVDGEDVPITSLLGVGGSDSPAPTDPTAPAAG
ncbi:hypothetical protein MF408_00935 [Nocardioides sp. TF02-7]|nr:hypothetical protein MF408_00935 [Nocardioides sp. TF02-7]